MSSNFFDREFQYVNALAGSGKTHQAIKWALEQALNGERIVFLQPTKQLIEQSFRDVLKDPRSASIEIKRFHGDVVAENQYVSQAIIEYLKSTTSNAGAIIFLTHAAFMTLPYFHRRGDWTVICDEVPSVFEVYERNLRSNYDLITEAVETIDHDAMYYELRRSKDKTKKAHLMRIVRNEYKDEAWDIVRPLAIAVASPFQRVFIRKELWATLISGRRRVRDVKFTAYIITQPSIFWKFEKTILLGALFEETLLYQFWRSKVMFKDFTPISSNLQYTVHKNAGMIHFKYFSEANWSKNLYNKEVDDKTIFEHFAQAIRTEFTGRKFLYSINNRIDDPFTASQGVRLPAVPHGRNDFQDIDDVAFLSALNPDPGSFGFCNYNGVGSQSVRDAIMKQSAYQALLRCSIRKPTCTNEHIVIIPTKALAEGLSKHFQNFDISKIDGVPEINGQKPGRPSSATQLTSTYRMRKKRRKPKIMEVLKLNGLDTECDINSIDLYRYSVTYSSYSLWPVTLHKVDTVTVPYSEAIEIPDEASLRAQLHQWWTRTVPTKHVNFLISAATFTNSQNRKRDDVACVWCLILDVDGGDMSPEDFRSIFPTTLMYLFNSYSDKRNRYRVLIPLTMKLNLWAFEDLHKSIKAAIEQSLQKFRYGKDKNLPVGTLTHGIDPICRNPEAIFYAPCQNENPDKCFFDIQEGKPLDVLGLLLQPIHNDLFEKPRSKNTVAVTQSSVPAEVAVRVSVLTQEYKKVPAGQGQRYTSFFHLGLALHWLGLSLDDIERELISADYDGSRRKKNQIHWVLHTLQNPKYAPHITHGGAANSESLISSNAVVTTEA